TPRALPPPAGSHRGRHDGRGAADAVADGRRAPRRSLCHPPTGAPASEVREYMAAPSGTNFGSEGHQQDLDSSVAYRFEIPERARRRWSGASNRRHWPQFVAESRVLEQPARRHGKVLRHEYTAWEYAERAFEHAHVLIKHHVRDGGAGQQRLDHGHQDGVIGSQDFVQNSPPESLCPPLDLPRCHPADGRSAALSTLAASP